MPPKVISHDTRSGRLDFEPNGYPTAATVRRLREEIDYQRAVQAYIHFLPAVAMTQWRNAHFGPLGGRNGDLIVYRTTDARRPIMGATGPAIFVAGFADLTSSGGALVYDVPRGRTCGTINDIWQRSVTDTGITGPDAGDGARYLVLLDGTPLPPNHGADVVVTCRTNTIHIGATILCEDPGEARRLLDGHRVHGLGTASATRILDASGRNWRSSQPRGLGYWGIVHQVLEQNPIEERDMALLQGLRAFGIEKGHVFDPTPAQAEILVEAARVGETWAMGNSFLGRDPLRHWKHDLASQWQYLLSMESPLDQMAPAYMEIDARAAYAYQAMTISEALSTKSGEGAIRQLVTYRDGAGRWLDGTRCYELIVPPDVPAQESWSIVLFDAGTRCMIENATGRPGISSRHHVVPGREGPYRLCLAPDRPDGVPEANWIQTNRDAGFFACFRFHAPTRSFFDRSWRLGNIEEVDGLQAQRLACAP